ncbi:MAG: CAP domain-containing protein [bacterium]
MKIFKNSGKIFIILLIFLSVFLFCNIAKANNFTDNFQNTFNIIKNITEPIKNNISSVFNFINNNIIGQIKKEFCHNYFLAISKDEWKKGEFRTNLGKKNCVSSDISKTTTADTDKIIQTILKTNKNLIVQIKKTFTNPSVNNPIPTVYIPNAIISGTDLNINQIIFFTNEERKNNNTNLSNLKENNILKKIAIIRVQDMFVKQYFEHNSPTGDNVSKEAVKNNYEYITIGENIALGNFDGDKKLVQAWMDSPGHRANILNKNYTELGVYAEQGLYKGQKIWIAAQIFSRPVSDCPEPEKVLKDKIAQYRVEADNMLINIKKIDEELKIANTADIQNYNLKITERNTLAEVYNNLVLKIKNLIIEYNRGVESFNSCIEKKL